MKSLVTAVPVIHYPGIFSALGTVQSVIGDGNTIYSRAIKISDMGENEVGDYPSGFLGVQSWIFAWSVYTHPIVAWVGTPRQWTKLVLGVELQPAGGPNFPRGEEFILPLSTDIIGVGASGEVRISSRAARLSITNTTGQSQTVTWDVWAKAA